MNQYQQVIETMRENGGYATLQQLNKWVDVSGWKTKTPYASIRRIVQTSDAFFKIKPGLWALNEFKNEVFKKLSFEPSNRQNDEIFTHGYYQGLLVGLGNLHNYGTYVPNQDKNRKFLETPLKDMVTISELPKFTYDNILKRAKTVDVIWFNERNLPCKFYEVEHSTDIRNSLDKYYELQDFRADYYIIADTDRKKEFDEVIERSIYKSIRHYVRFFAYENLVKQYENEHSLVEKI